MRKAREKHAENRFSPNNYHNNSCSSSRKEANKMCNNYNGCFRWAQRGSSPQRGKGAVSAVTILIRFTVCGGRFGSDCVPRL